jgi:hypothetical protein
VVLESRQVAGFAQQFEWEGGTAVTGKPHQVRVSRSAAGRYHVKLENKANGRVVDEVIAWIVWATISATGTANGTGDQGKFFRVRMNYEFEHAIQPRKIITDADRPNLSGANTVPVPTAGALNYVGNALTGGASKKWDS